METTGAAFERLSREVDAADRVSYPLAELNDLLTVACGADVEGLPRPAIRYPYRLNCVTAMVELAAHRTGVLPPLWTASGPAVG